MVENLNGCLAILFFLSKKELVMKGVYNRPLIDNCQKTQKNWFWPVNCGSLQSKNQSNLQTTSHLNHGYQQLVA
jgi:hypothetical protein